MSHHKTYIFAKSYRALFTTLLFSLVLAGCGGGNSSSENNAEEGSTVTASNGATVNFSSNDITAGEVITLSYDLDSQTAKEARSKEGSPGTIRWGDLQQDRVRGSGNARHRYRSPGRYSVSVQIDGGESMRVGFVNVEPAPVPEPEEQASPSVAIVNPTTIDCSSSTPVPIMLNGQSFTLISSGSFIFNFTINNASGAQVATSTGLVACPGTLSFFNERATVNGVAINVQEQVGTTIFLITFTP